MGNRGQGLRLTLAGAALSLLPGLSHAADCRDDTVMLRGGWGEARFTVEVADDNDERAQGLMHRESMPQSAGMLFVYEKPRRARFWMKNTLIPLDMIFADKTGTVRHVHIRAEPLSERLISGGRDIQYVLEINGGLAEALGITPGSQLRHPSIGENAAWPC